MNLRTTLLLLILAGGCVGLFYKGPEVATKLGLPTLEPAIPAESAQLLTQIRPDNIKRIEIATAKDTLELKADAPGKPLEMTGNWPTRQSEVEQLKSLLTSLYTRFAPIPITGESKLEEYGLGKSNQPVTVKIESSGATETLVFGQPEVKPGENPFTRPTYLRVDNKPELLRLGPDVMPVLNRKPDYYRRRQLFPDTERIRFDEGNGESSTSIPVLTDAVQEIVVNGPAGRYALSRTQPTPKPAPPEGKPGADATLAATKLADAWEISQPLVDRVDPTKLKNILTTIPDIWVEQFIEEKDSTKTGLEEKDKPLELTLKLTNGGNRTLLIGRITRVNTRTEAAPPPQPGMPPQPPKIIEEKFYHARLANNPQLFEIKGDKLAEVFFNDSPPMPQNPEEIASGPKRALDELRDANLVRLDADRVTKIQINRPDQSRLVLDKTKADGKDATKKDRWDLEQPFKGLAENQPVEDLIRPLVGLKSGKKEILDRPTYQILLGGFAFADLQTLHLDLNSATEVRLTADGKTKTLYIGRHDPLKKKVYVRVEGQERIDVVGDDFLTAMNKQARAYRSLKLFDLGDNRIDAITAQRGAVEKFALQEIPGATTKWQLLEPVKTEADTSKASSAISNLANLEATEFVFDPLTEKEKSLYGSLLGASGLAVLNGGDGFGFGQPTLQVKVHFAGPKPPTEQTLQVGNARADKPEQYYARLAGSPTVFSINKSAIESLNLGSVNFLSTQLWAGANPTKITIQKGTEQPYTLVKNELTWKITSPFESGIDIGSVAPLLGSLSSVSVVKYEAHNTTDLKKYGLDAPTLKITFQATEKGPQPDAKEVTQERTLLIGNADGPAKEPAKPNYFAKLADKPAIFVVPDILFADANKSAFDLLSKNLLNIPLNEVNKIQTNIGSEAVTLIKSGAEWKPEGATFALDRPAIEGLLRTAANLSAEKFVAFGPKVEFAKYGLDDASKPAKITIGSSDKSHVILLGKETENKLGRFVRIDTSPGVAVVPIPTASELNKTKLDFVDKSLIRFDPLELQAIHRTMNGKELELVSDTRGWKIAAPTKEKADQPTLEELADRLTNLRAIRCAALDVKDFVPFGLDKPASVVTLDRLDAKGKESKYTLKIGKPVNDKSPDRFVALDGSSTVLVLAGSTATKLLAEPVAFRDRTLATFLNADKIVVQTPQNTRTFTKGDTGWKVTEPVKADADDESLRELHDILAKLRADEFVAEKAAKLEDYGLDKPTHWKLSASGKEVLDLLVGKKESGPGQRVYAKLANDDRIALLDSATSTKLTQEYRKRTLWETLDVAQANSISVDFKDDKGSYRFMKGPAGWLDANKPADPIKAETVTDFLDCMAGLKAEKFVTDKEGDYKLYGLKPAERVITVATPAGKRTLEIGRVDDSKRAYAKLPDKPEILLLSEKDTQRLLKDRAGFAK